MVTLDAYWLNVVVGTLLPIVVALVTNKFASSQVKSLTLLALTVVGGALTSIQASGGSFELKPAITGAILSYVVSVATYYGLWKPTQVAGSDGKVATAVPGGIG